MIKIIKKIFKRKVCKTKIISIASSYVKLQGRDDVFLYALTNKGQVFFLDPISKTWCEVPSSDIIYR